MQMIEAVSGNSVVATILRRRYSDFNRVPASLVDGGPNTDQAVVAANAPSLLPLRPAGGYQPGNFVAYPQAPEGRSDTDVTRLSDVLAKKGFDVQATQRIAPSRSPLRNEVRYYRADQEAFATQTAGELSARLCLPVFPRRLGGGQLPNGVMEFWLGTSRDATTPRPGCTPG